MGDMGLQLGVSSRFCFAGGTVERWGPENLGKTGEEGPQGVGCISFPNMPLYIKLVLYIYTIKIAIHTYIQKLYIHLFTVMKMLLRSCLNSKLGYAN